MKKPERTFTIEVGKSAILGIEPGAILTIQLIGRRTGQDTMRYSAPIEKVHKALAAWHARAHPTGRRRRTLARGKTPE